MNKRVLEYWYYSEMSHCVACERIYPVAESKNKVLCLECKEDALNWPFKPER